MARWERDPRARKRMAILLAVGNDIMLLLVAFFFGNHLVNTVWAKTVGEITSKTFLLHHVLVGVFAAWLVVHTILYIRGARWARSAYIILNIALIVMGLLWFLFSWIQHGKPEPHTLKLGLLLPLCLLLPILWPHFTFKPKMPLTPGRARAAPGAKR